MKHFFLLSLFVLLPLSSYADFQLGLVGYDALSSGDTIVTTEYQQSVLGDIEMGVRGTLFTSAHSVSVELTRDELNRNDQLCVGQCVYGNGLLSQTFNFTTSISGMNQFFTHYIPTQENTTYTATYTFHADADTFVLTILYAYKTESALPSVVSRRAVRCVRDGRLEIVRDGRRYSVLGNRL